MFSEVLPLTLQYARNYEMVQKILATQEKEELKQAFQVIHKMINSIESIPIETLSYRKEENE